MRERERESERDGWVVTDLFKTPIQKNMDHS